MESVRRARPICGGIGQGIDDLQLLDDRAGPSVGDDERQRIPMLRTNVNEMDVQPIDLGDELRQRIELRFDFAPVVIGRPISRELLHRRERHALRCIRDRLPFRPPVAFMRLRNARRVPLPEQSTWKGAIAALSGLRVFGNRARRRHSDPQDRASPRAAAVIASGCRCLFHGDCSFCEFSTAATHANVSRWRARTTRHRSDLNAARSSDAKSAGSSHAAKCPPRSTSLK